MTATMRESRARVHGQLALAAAVALVACGGTDAETPLASSHGTPAAPSLAPSPVGEVGEGVAPGASAASGSASPVGEGVGPAAPAASAASGSPAPTDEPVPSIATPSSGIARALPTSLRVTFDEATPGEPPSGVEPVVGDWSVGEADGARGLLVDGTRWREGTPSASLADSARRLYGDRYAEFLDGVRAFAFFPLAVFDAEPPAGDLRISVRFFAISGRIDQAAGIAFGITPDGSYEGVRANPLEDNLLYFRVVRGRRSILQTVRDVPTRARTWHTLVVELRGRSLRVTLDDVERLTRDLDAAPVGRVGLWSKADSQVLFDDFVVEHLE